MHPDTLYILDENLAILVGHVVEEEKDDHITPFYITLNVDGKLLCNLMLYSGDSHNLMPKFIMDQLDLEITKPCHDLYIFESKK